MPPLVTTSPSGTPRDQAGVLGTPGTRVLFGDQPVDDNVRQGLRLTLGHWLDNCRLWGVEAQWFYVGDDAGGNFAAESTGNPILARPFFNVNRNTQDSLPVVFPAVTEGRIDVDTSSEVQSAGILVRRTWLRGGCGQVAFLGGYRYFRFRESLAVGDSFTIVDETGLIDYGTTVETHESFVVQNDFHGGEFGLAAQLERGAWSLDMLGKLGLGSVHQQLDVNGGTTIQVPDLPPLSSPGGILTGPNNIGHYGADRFAFLPELGVNVGYCLTTSLRLHAGYSLIYLTDVRRTGDQLDPAIGGGHPQVAIAENSLGVQGCSVGLEWRR